MAIDSMSQMLQTAVLDLDERLPVSVVLNACVVKVVPI